MRGLVEHFEQPGKRRHDRLWHHRAWLVQVDVLPDLAGLARPDVDQVRSGALGAQQFRSLVCVVACGRGPAEHLVAGQRAHLLRVTVAAAIGNVHVPPRRLDRRERFDPRPGRGPRQLVARDHAHHQGEPGVHEGRAAGDRHELVQADAPAASAGASGSACALRPTVIRQTFQPNTRWLTNISRPPTPRQTQYGPTSSTD